MKPWLVPVSFMLMISVEASAGTIIKICDYGAEPNSGQDATPIFQKALADARKAGQKGPVTLDVPAGDYHFFSTLATRRKCFLSNATDPALDGTRTIALDLSDIDNLTLSGVEARFLMRGMMTMVVAERCENLTIRGVEFDFIRPTFSEVKVLEIGDDHWVGEVHKDSWYRIIDHQSIEWFGEDWKLAHNIGQSYDPVLKSVSRGRDPLTNLVNVEQLEGRKLKFTVPEKDLKAVRKGTVYQFRDGTRNECGMWFNRSRNVVLEGISVRAMHGFGILSQFTEDVTINRLTVAPAEGSGRTCASPADVLHFSGCRGRIQILDSTLTAAHDDALNVHGTHLRIMEQPAPNQLTLRFMHKQTWGFQAFVPGDQVEIVDQATLLPRAGATVVAVEMNDSRHQTITLDREPDCEIQLDSDAVENVTWTPSVHVNNCYVGQIPTRGFLFTTRRPVRVENTTFDRPNMDGILIEDDASGWYESGPVHDLIIRKNTFIACGRNGVRISPHYKKYGGPIHKNLRIKDNTFILRDARSLVVSARSADGLVIEGNRIQVKGDATDMASLISLKDTTNVTVTNNSVEVFSEAGAL